MPTDDPTGVTEVLEAEAPNALAASSIGKMPIYPSYASLAC